MKEKFRCHSPPKAPAGYFYQPGKVYSIDDHMPDNYLHVSRYTLAPDSVVEPASRSSLVWLAQPAARWIGKAGATASRLVARLEAALPEGLIRSA